MAKISRELALLRRLLSQGGTDLKLVLFQQKDGDKVAVNPDHVAAIEQRKETSTRIKMRDGSSHTVEATFEDVVDALQE